jgi:hypothetical protein
MLAQMACRASADRWIDRVSVSIRFSRTMSTVSSKIAGMLLDSSFNQHEGKVPAKSSRSAGTSAILLRSGSGAGSGMNCTGGSSRIVATVPSSSPASTDTAAAVLATSATLRCAVSVAWSGGFCMSSGHSCSVATASIGATVGSCNSICSVAGPCSVACVAAVRRVCHLIHTPN